ncbi:MAG TPA: acetate--CoA ligase family protein [Haliangium sp.]|nr:acetate--CoA ligase family protein [Haliangium sp.]
MPRVREAAPLPRVALAVEDAAFASDAARALAARGLHVEPLPLDRVDTRPETRGSARGDTRGDDRGDARGDARGERSLATEPAGRPVWSVGGPIAFAPDEPPDADTAARLAPLCVRAAEAERPVVLLAAFQRERGRAAWQRAAALAYLRAHGAIVCGDPDVWLETVALLAAYGVPEGPRVAIVAPEGSWLGAAATALANEAERLGQRFPEVAASASRVEPTDVVLVDRAALSPSSPDRVGNAMVVPVLARAELLGHDARVPLVGLRASLAAVAEVGRFARRLAGGLGPGSAPELVDPAPEQERFQRQLDKLDTRAGDHEAKVLLASYGIPVTRQAVATTPSAATRLAKKAGFPVEVKPWGPDQLSERDGCPVQRDLHTAADVRRGMAAVARAAGLPEDAPVIVRETPPAGREVSAHISRLGALGWMVVVEVAGVPEPAAAPAPLGPVDVAELTALVQASRASDPEPDREALADMLVRAAALAVDHQGVIEALYLHRIIVTPRTERSLVADAQAVLVPRTPAT